MIARRAEILPDGENVAAHSSQIAEYIKQFMRLFAEAHHHARFRDSAGVQLFGVAQQLQRTLIARAGADNAIQPRHRLGVVVHHLGLGIDHNA